jgi:nitrogen fixation NifU-like protein
VSAEVYHDALVALAREATGAGRLPAPAASATRDNPLCGDRVTFEVRVADGRVEALAHQVRGCLLCQASASFLGGHAAGHRRADLASARSGLAALLADGTPLPAGAWAGLALFEPVGAVKSRHGCVLLAFDALDDALAGAEV